MKIVLEERDIRQAIYDWITGRQEFNIKKEDMLISGSIPIKKAIGEEVTVGELEEIHVELTWSRKE